MGSKILSQLGALSRKRKKLKSTAICHGMCRIIQTILRHLDNLNTTPFNIPKKPLGQDPNWVGEGESA